ncbi:MAG: glycosyltransferase family 2 protein [Actinobacteria bacterium]|nr:glycosyltransferase family 2 protein [Actinomycetota bacterium]
MNKEATIDVIIVTYNSETFIGRCLGSLFNDQEHIEKIVVVDNASNDDTVGTVRTFDGVELIELKDNIGFSRASNIAFQRTGSEYVMFLNPDCFVVEYALSGLFDRAASLGDDCIIGPRILNVDMSLQLSARSFHNLITQFSESFFLFRLFPKSRVFGRYFLQYEDHGREFQPDWITGAVMFMPRMLFEAVGLFDERFFMFEEDADLCYRARKLGYRVVYHPGSTFIHCDAGSFAESDEYRRLKLVYSSRLKYYRKYMGRLRTFFFLVLVRIGFLNRGWIYMLSGQISRMRTFFRLAFAGLGDEVG